LPAGAPAVIALGEASAAMKGMFDTDEATEMSNQSPA
jgi:hypothetical protein